MGPSSDALVSAHDGASSSSPALHVLCERTLLGGVTLVTKVFLSALPSLLNEGAYEGAAPPAALAAAWRCVASIVDTALDASWRVGEPPLPSLVEALSELSRNVLLVLAAEVRVNPSGGSSQQQQLEQLLAMLPPATGGASLRAVATVIGLVRVEAPPEPQAPLLRVAEEEVVVDAVVEAVSEVVVPVVEVEEEVPVAEANDVA